MRVALRDAIPDRYRPPLTTEAKKARYFGLRYKRPFCNSSLRGFGSFGLDLPALKQKEVIGGGLRPNARCPACASIDHERLLWMYLRSRARIAPNAIGSYT